jgi:phosphoglycerate dehydrogenase-like enzyme
MTGSKARVVFLHGLDPRLVQCIVACNPPGFETVAIDGKAPEDTQVEAVRDADFLMIYRARPKAAVFRAARRAKLVQLLSAGYDMLDLPLLRELKLPLSNNAGANSYAVADHTVLAMLALYRRLLAGDAAVRQGRWQAEIDGTNTYEMANKLVGIVGLGNIGRKVARRVQAFDAQVQYHNRTRLAPAEERELNVRWAPLDELFRTSDIVSLHTPLGEHSRGMVNAERLAMMKPTATLINTARGEVVDQAALVEALRSRRILGAGLDAFDPEPLPADSPLRELDNVVLSPHSAGTTWDTWTRRGDFAYGNFQRVWAGAPAEALV